MKKEKLFIVRKYVRAESVEDALHKEKRQKVDDCWVDEAWKAGEADGIANAIGFKQEE